MNKLQYSFYVDLTTENFANIGYRTQGGDNHLGKKHSHEGFEIIQVCSGSGNVLIKDKLYPLSPGSIFIINATEPHFINPDNHNDYTRNKITFSLSFMEELFVQVGHPYVLSPFTDNSSKYCIEPTQQIADEFDSLFKTMYTENIEKPPAYDSIISSCLYKMLVMIYRESIQNNKHNTTNHSFVSMMIDYISDNLADAFTIDEMCDYLHISKYYSCRLFKKITGMTIMQYITQRRISKAKSLLINSQYSITEIAEIAGFSSLSFFSRTFRRYEKCTPMQFRV